MWTTSTNYLKATSRWVFGWITGDWPSQADTQNWPSLYLSSFFFEKNPNICTVITAFCSPLGFALMYIIFGEQSLLGKRGFLLKILTCKMPSLDLWSSRVWGLVQTWGGRTVSMFWSLSIPHPSKWGARFSDVSVWVTAVSCSRLPTSCRTGGLHSGEWFLVWPKVLWNLHKAPFPTESGGEMGQVQPPLLTRM